MTPAIVCGGSVARTMAVVFLLYLPQDIKKKVSKCKDEKATILDLSKCDVSPLCNTLYNRRYRLDDSCTMPRRCAL